MSAFTYTASAVARVSYELVSSVITAVDNVTHFANLFPHFWLSDLAVNTVLSELRAPIKSLTGFNTVNFFAEYTTCTVLAAVFKPDAAI